MKDYCTQNNGDCKTCSLANYNLDCENNPIEENELKKRQEIENKLKYGKIVKIEKLYKD